MDEILDFEEGKLQYIYGKETESTIMALVQQPERPLLRFVKLRSRRSNL
jgi:hypothetical protein